MESGCPPGWPLLEVIELLKAGGFKRQLWGPQFPPLSFPFPSLAKRFLFLCSILFYQAQSRTEYRSWIKAFNIWAKTNPSFYVYLPLCYNEKKKKKADKFTTYSFSIHTVSVKSGCLRVISITPSLLLPHVSCLFNYDVPHPHEAKSSVSVHST